MPGSRSSKLQVVQDYLQQEFPGYVMTHSEEAETGLHLIKLKNSKSYHVAIAEDFLAERDAETIQNDLAIARVDDRVRQASAGGRVMLSAEGIAVERPELA